MPDRCRAGFLIGVASYLNTGIVTDVSLVLSGTTILHSSNRFFPKGQNHISIENTFRCITVSVNTA